MKEMGVPGGRRAYIMSNCLDEVKATQAAAFFLRSAQGQNITKYRKLVRLMYLADREALVRLGNKITHGRHCSLPDGPVISEVNDLLTDSDYAHKYQEQGYWSEHIICTRENGVSLLHDPGTGRLAASHIAILECVVGKYGELSDDELGKITHLLPEYDQPEGKWRVSTIEPAKTLRNGAFTAEQAEGIARENEAYDFFRQLVKQ
jgi:uncharacterized phage-associated protein